MVRRNVSRAGSFLCRLPRGLLMQTQRGKKREKKVFLYPIVLGCGTFRGFSPRSRRGLKRVSLRGPLVGFVKAVIDCGVFRGFSPRSRRGQHGRQYAGPLVGCVKAVIDCGVFRGLSPRSRRRQPVAGIFVSRRLRCDVCRCTRHG